MSIQHESQPPYSRWLTEEVFKLIDMVRSDEAIYNPRHKYYFCRPYVENFWREVDLRLRKNPGASLSKWTVLRISFRREYTNYQKEKVPPCWSYFDNMLFLHPYLRNKKPSGPKDVDSHLQEALASITNINFKPLPLSTNVSPVNDYMDHYLSYCEDDPHPSPGMDDIIEEEVENEASCNIANSIRNEIKSECEIENDDKDLTEYKDIIVEISDDFDPIATETGLKRDSIQSDVASRSLLKRCRTEPVGSSNVVAPSSNISLVRPLAMAPVSPEINSLHHSSMSSSHTSSLNRMPSGPASPARINEFCECKSDSDAMFLMSMLPDIRKLRGRDRGKIKIAFQNILQEYLYPD